MAIVTTIGEGGGWGDLRGIGCRYKRVLGNSFSGLVDSAPIKTKFPLTEASSRGKACAKTQNTLRKQQQAKKQKKGARQWKGIKTRESLVGGGELFQERADLTKACEQEGLVT